MRLIKIPDDGIVREYIWSGDSVIGERRVNLSYLPTVDAVEVVRCKDCKWYEPDTEWGIDEATGRRDHSKIVKKDCGECQGQNFHFTEDGFLRVGENDFCSYGERKGGKY